MLFYVHPVFGPIIHDLWKSIYNFSKVYLTNGEYKLEEATESWLSTVFFLLMKITETVSKLGVFPFGNIISFSWIVIVSVARRVWFGYLYHFSLISALQIADKFYVFPLYPIWLPLYVLALNCFQRLQRVSSGKTRGLSQQWATRQMIL